MIQCCLFLVTMAWPGLVTMVEIAKMSWTLPCLCILPFPFLALATFHRYSRQHFDWGVNIKCDYCNPFSCFFLSNYLSFDPSNRIRNPESGKIWFLESRIHNDGIWNPDLIWNPESNEFRIRNPEGWNLESSGSESGIQMVGIRNPDGWNLESRTSVDSDTWVDIIQY